MEDQNFINQWMSQYGDLSAPMAAAFLEDDIQQSFVYDHQPLMEASTGFDDFFHSRPTTELGQTTPIPEPHNSFSFSHGSAAAAPPSCLYSAAANLTRADVIIPTLTYNVAPEFPVDHQVWDDSNYVLISGQKEKNRKCRSSGAQDHIDAERKRRQKLSQKFIALSAVVPGLKKTDKASVLAAATKYLKQLQDRVKILEDQTRSKTTESVLVLKKSQLVIDDSNKGFSSETFIQGTPHDETAPEIEVRVCNNNVLIRVHCVKLKGVIEKILSEFEKLDLTVINSNVITFGTSAFSITIVAQMDAGCWMSVNNLAKTLRVALKNFM